MRLSACVVAGAVPAAILALRQLIDLPPEFIPPLLLAVDHALAATLVTGVLWCLIKCSCNAGLHSVRSELYCLRVVSSLLAAGGATCLVVQLLPRQVLVACTALYIGLSLNFSCWRAALRLHVHDAGLVSILPARLERRPLPIQPRLRPDRKEQSLPAQWHVRADRQRLRLPM